MADVFGTVLNNNLIFGFAGDDIIASIIAGVSGDDTFVGQEGSDTVGGNLGNDWIRAGAEF